MGPRKLHRLKAAARKIADWVAPIVLTVLVTTTWNRYQASRPKLMFTIRETQGYVTGSADEDGRRYELTIWHNLDHPLKDLMLGVKPILNKHFMRLKFQTDLPKSDVWVTTEQENPALIAKSLKVQQRITGTLDCNVPVSATDVILSSADFVGAEYIPVWREPLLRSVTIGWIQGLAYGAILVICLNSFLGGKYTKLLRESRETLSKEAEQLKANLARLKQASAEDSQQIGQQLDALERIRDRLTHGIDEAHTEEKRLIEQIDGWRKEILSEIEDTLAKQEELSGRLKQASDAAKDSGGNLPRPD